MEFAPRIMMKFIPKLMMGMMPKMINMDVNGGQPVMPQMMVKMMPQCLNTMLPSIQKEKRVEFIMKIIPILVEQGSFGMSEEEKRDFLAEVIKKMNT
jgi:hypothetical protein